MQALHFLEQRPGEARLVVISSLALLSARPNLQL
jgi:hypothetical protein